MMGGVFLAAVAQAGEPGKTLRVYFIGNSVTDTVRYGTLAEHHLHWVRNNRIPAQDIHGTGEGGIEILSMSGLVVEGQPHIHVALATTAGAYGGHLEEGCIAYVLCEIVFAEVEGTELRRERVRVSVPGMGEGEVPRLIFGK